MFEPQLSEAKSHIASADHTTVPTHGYKKDKPFTFSQASKKSQGSALVWVSTQLNIFLNPRFFRWKCRDDGAHPVPALSSPTGKPSEEAGLEGILCNHVKSLRRVKHTLEVTINSLHMPAKNSCKLLAPGVCPLVVSEEPPNITALSHLP